VLCVLCPSLKFGNNRLTRDEYCSRVMPLEITPASYVTNNNVADELANYDVEVTTAHLGLRPVQVWKEVFVKYGTSVKISLQIISKQLEHRKNTLFNP